jgi:hypothetical protein
LTRGQPSMCASNLSQGPGSPSVSQGVHFSDIVTRLGHDLSSVERYLDDFCVVMMGLDDGYSTARIARNTRMEEKLVEEYALLYYRYSSLGEYASIIARLRERQAYILKKSLLEGEETGPTPGSAPVILELGTREEIQEKNELPFLSLELQVTIIRASIRKMLVA